MAASTANAGSLHVQLLPYDYSDTDPGPLAETLALGPRSIALWRELAAMAGTLNLGRSDMSELALAEAAVDATTELSGSLGMPLRLRDAGVDRPDLASLAATTLKSAATMPGNRSSTSRPPSIRICPHRSEPPTAAMVWTMSP